MTEDSAWQCGHQTAKNSRRTGCPCWARRVYACFLLAGISKVQSPGSFADAVRAFHLLPPGLVLPFAYSVPWLEILVGVYLLVGFLSRLAALGAVVLLASFIIALVDALATGNTAHACGCFGSGAGTNPILAALAGGDSVGWWDVIRDVILVEFAGIVLWWGAGPLSADDLVAHRREREFAD